MTQLKKYIENLEQKLGSVNKKEYQDFCSIKMTYPFSKPQNQLLFFLSNKIISYSEFKKVIEEYNQRNKNIDLYLKTSKVFGTTWAENHVKSFSKDFQKPSTKLDPNFVPQLYDLWFDGIKVEVKASRAVDKTNPSASLPSKALNTESENDFLMNFQQLKPACSDVFVFVGVWTDKILYWVIPSSKITPIMKKQHRNSVNEGQHFLTNDNIHEWDEYLTESIDVPAKIKEIYQQEHQAEQSIQNQSQSKQKSKIQHH